MGLVLPSSTAVVALLLCTVATPSSPWFPTAVDAFVLPSAVWTKPNAVATHRTRSSTQHYYVSSTEPTSSSKLPEPSNNNVEKQQNQSLPPLNDDGMYELETPEDHAQLLQAFADDNIIVLKVFAPWCRACKSLHPKFKALKQEEKYQDKPIIWANFSIRHNKKFVQSLGVLALPTIQFYVNGQIYDTFACGPSKVPILKRKLSSLLSTHVDSDTNVVVVPSSENTESVPQPAAAERERTEPALSSHEQQELVSSISYLNSIQNKDDLYKILQHAVVRHYPANSVLVREGQSPKKFYLLCRGEVEICQRNTNVDPFLNNEQYLGTVINVLQPYDCFGERSLITGEPCAASLRASTDVVLWEMDQSLFPASSVLSGRSGTINLESVNDKYGVDDMVELRFGKQLKDTSLESQTRGSIHKPGQLSDIPDLYEGGTYDPEFVVELEDAATPSRVNDGGSSSGVHVKNDDTIFQLLKKFQNIRTVSACFQYIQQHNVKWGGESSNVRRNMLVGRLDPSQRSEYEEIFNLIDVNKDGCVQVNEMKRLYDSIGEPEVELFQQDNACVLMSQEDFLGLMAESFFYNLFRDVFSSLDKNGSGFVKAKELDHALNGIRDLIMDDRKSVIDVDDQDMLIDYEQFSRMLLGTTSK